jgi:CubicO group peptidase (beta-lactamase class C family)
MQIRLPGSIPRQWLHAAAVLMASATPAALALAWGETHPHVLAPAVIAAAHAVPVPTVRADDLLPKLARRPLEGAMAAVQAEVRRGAFPGAALALGRGSRAELVKGIGATTGAGEGVDAERTVYDLASLTKVVATTTAAMLLYEDGRLELDAPVSRYLPEFSGDGKDAVTVRHLLAHTAGLPAGASPRGATPDARLASLIRTPLERSPGAKVEYSDVGFVVLFAALERSAGEPIPALLERRVWEPLGMASTGYAPGPECERCAPTYRNAAGRPVAGVVHDPIARSLDGVAGNAGLFSTAADLSRYAAMLASGGELEGVRVLKPETVDTFAVRQEGTRALGWETPSANGTGPVGRSMSDRAFGTPASPAPRLGGPGAQDLGGAADQPRVQHGGAQPHPEAAPHGACAGDGGGGVGRSPPRLVDSAPSPMTAWGGAFGVRWGGGGGGRRRGGHGQPRGAAPTRVGAGGAGVRSGGRRRADESGLYVQPGMCMVGFAARTGVHGRERLTASSSFTEALRTILEVLREGAPTHARLNGAAFRIDQLGRQLHGLGLARDREVAHGLNAAVRLLGESHVLAEDARAGAVSEAVRHLRAALAHAEEGGASAES